MSNFEKKIVKWNFKKIAIGYLIIAVFLGLVGAVSVGILYRERLNFAWQYSRLHEAEDENTVKTAADKTASASSDVVDILITDQENQVIYSAKNSEFSKGAFSLEKLGEEKKYLLCARYPDAAFRYVKSEEFMLRSIINKDFGKIKEDYGDDSFFENALSSKNIYMLNVIRLRENGQKLYVISAPTTVPHGSIALKAFAALALLLFCIYWVLIALWLYADAAKCKLSPIYWGLIGLLTNLIGLIVYKIYKRSLAICPSCGAAQFGENLYCTVCGAALGKRCESCGRKVGDKDIYCRHCGNRVD